ncbi:MAG: toprim domain-containing protein [Bacteroidetes bacterium]|nr:toprim domain-containing protein [Bacteroidota bacterium]
MELKEIKAQLSIGAVLHYYGLQPDRNQRLHCPFHVDNTPSMQIYPATNTWCCFSSNCKAGTGDVIQFIQLKENFTKHEALVKATELVNHTTGTTTDQPPTAKLTIDTELLAREAVLGKVFSYYQRGLRSAKRALDYLQSRSLDYTKLEVAYNSGGLHTESKNHHLVASMVNIGLLKPRPAGGYTVWAKDCIVFPLKSPDNKIVSFYGRSITDTETGKHFYLTNRMGLYPGHPNKATTKLILTESVIDAASLLQQASITENYSVLALYGTNGLIGEHLLAIQSLANLAEIIFLLDADPAGRRATEKHGRTLQQLLPAILLTQVCLPEGEDVNSVLQTHDDPKCLTDLIEQRITVAVGSHAAAADASETTPAFLFQLKEKNPAAPEVLPFAETSPPVGTTTAIATESALPETPAATENAFPETPLRASKLSTTNAELLVYTDGALRIEVLGGIRITGLDRLRVTLKLLHEQRPGSPVWHSLDLYHHAQREQLITLLTDSLDLPVRNTTDTITGLTTALEHYRLERIEALQPKKATAPEMTPAQRQAALTELQHSNLLGRTSQLIAASGLVGETTNALTAYLVYCTRKQPIPLHVMFLGASGSGKTYLQEKISALVPTEDKIEITQVTENALYYFKQEELKHKLLLIEDLDGAQGVFYPLRELQTKRRISKTVTLKDNKGNLKTITLTVEGPVSVSGCTTKEKLYEDNANRCLLLYTDTSKAQDKKINDYQTRLAAGEVNRDREQRYKELFQSIQRLLRPIAIVNPFAKYIQLPEPVFKPRRTMTLLLGFIEAVTFYHQYQREVKRDASGQLYIETTLPDIEQAFALLKDVLFSKSDELTQATRVFFERLKAQLTESNQASFTAQAIRKAFRLEPRTIQRYIRELHQYGLIRAVSGFKHRKGVEYAVTDEREYSQLKTAIDTHLEAILEQLKRWPATATPATVLRQ